MKRSRSDILADVLQLLRELADDWEYSGAITRDTCLVADMGLESLDVVILGLAVQERYGQTMPVPELLAEIGQRDKRDISVGEWVDFIHEHVNDVGGQNPEDRAHS
jgi:acyl carrier protein